MSPYRRQESSRPRAARLKRSFYHAHRTNYLQPFRPQYHLGIQERVAQRALLRSFLRQITYKMIFRLLHYRPRRRASSTYIEKRESLISHVKRMTRYRAMSGRNTFPATSSDASTPRRSHYARSVSPTSTPAREEILPSLPPRGVRRPSSAGELRAYRPQTKRIPQGSESEPARRAKALRGACRAQRKGCATSLNGTRARLCDAP